MSHRRVPERSGYVLEKGGEDDGDNGDTTLHGRLRAEEDRTYAEREAANQEDELPPMARRLQEMNRSTGTNLPTPTH